MNVDLLIFEALSWLADAALRTFAFFASLTEPVLTYLQPYLVTFLNLTDQLPQLSEICALVLAVAVLLLGRRVRRSRAAMRGMVTELEQFRQQFIASDRRQKEMEERIMRVSNELAGQRGRVRAMEARVGKPDPQVATAMARAGTRKQDMVECGLSHGEVHLLHALNSARPAQTHTERAVG